MGVFCVNFHVQSENSKAVTKALARIVDVEALVAPPKNGWITFFDASASVQDVKQLVRIVRSLSRKLQTAVFGFLVHDSSVFQYHLYDHGKLLDQYDSRPDYFGVVSAAKRRKFAGRPDVLLRRARAGVTLENIQSILSDGLKIRLEEERAAAFAALFGIDRGLALADFKDIDDNREGYESVLSKVSPLAHALTEAVMAGDIASIRSVLAQGASPNVTSEYESLLGAAIRNENFELVRLLREFGGMVEVALDDGTKLDNHLAGAVSQAAHTGRMEILEFLLTEPHRGSARTRAGGLCEAVRRGSLQIVERFLEARTDVNLLDAAGSLALVQAVKRGHSRMTARLPSPPPPTDWETMVQVLLDAGADVNGRQRDGVTPLMSAAWNNELGFVRQLLVLGADPNARLESGLTALMLAGSSGYQEVVDVLAFVTETQRDQNAGSLWAAASAGDLAAVEKALAAGVSPNALAGLDLNPLLAAAMNKHSSVVARLLGAGANPNFSTKYNGLTPLWYAKAWQDEPTIKLLVEAGAIDPIQHRQGPRSP